MSDTEEKLSVREHLGKLDGKLDMLIKIAEEERQERIYNCKQHRDDFNALKDRVESVEHWKYYITGAGALVSFGFLYLKEEIKAKLKGIR